MAREVFQRHPPKALVEVEECELDANFLPGLVVTINNVDVIAGDGGEFDDLEILIGWEIAQNWSSQPTFVSGKLDWYAGGRIEPGMRIGGTLFKTDVVGSYTPRFNPMFQVSDSDLTFQTDQQNCKKLPDEVRALVDEGELLLLGQRNISDGDLVSIKDESARDDSGDFISYTSSFCVLKGILSLRTMTNV